MDFFCLNTSNISQKFSWMPPARNLMWFLSFSSISWEFFSSDYFQLSYFIGWVLIFSLIFWYLIIIWLCVDFFVFILLVVYWLFWICDLASVIILANPCPFSSSNIYSLLFQRNRIANICTIPFKIDLFLDILYSLTFLCISVKKISDCLSWKLFILFSNRSSLLVSQSETSFISITVFDFWSVLPALSSVI
jgi:hypothetical protein